MPRPRLWALLAGALGAAGASDPPRGGLVESDPVRGEYGFLSTFGGITEEQARENVRRMVDSFGVLEFQFYDAFSGYSPPAGEIYQEWTTPLFGRPVTRAVIQACTDEVKKLGGRSWLYVQAMGTDPGDLEVQKGLTVIGKHRVNGEVLLDVVLPSADWALRIASPWASFASSLGFSGLHWDMLGNFKSRMPDGSVVADFLRAAGQQLRAQGLAQTCNFVDGHGWDASLVGGTGWSSRVVAFPYWEVWTLPAVEDRFFEEVAPLGGVLSCFPGKGPDHEGEAQNGDAAGVWPLDLMISRWRKARCHGGAYLAIGDGGHHVQSEYLPDSSNISEADVAKIRRELFARPCGQGSGDGGADAAPAWPEGQTAAGPARGVPMDPLRGEYGFLTDFGTITETEARARVRGMAGSFGILEFQFFDAFEGYSRPPGEGEEEWVNIAFNRSIKRSVVRAYVDEIRSLGGRSWLYVQAMGTDPNDSKAQAGFDVAGAHMLGDRRLLDVVLPSARWAKKIAPQWAAFAASLGFSGVHWDTMPVAYSSNGSQAGAADLGAFLREALGHLLQRGLAQACTFTSGFPWDPALASGAGWSNSLVAFPYWVAWSLPADEDTFFEQVAPRGGGVYACYPGVDAQHRGEGQNEAEEGVWPLDLLVRRWRKTRCRGSAYVAVGDGARHVQSNYLPDTAAITFGDLAKIHDSVLLGDPCDAESNEEDHSSVDPVMVLPDHGEHSLRTAAPARQRSSGVGLGGAVLDAPAWLRWLAFGALVGVSAVSVGVLLARAWAPPGTKEAGFRAVGEAGEALARPGERSPPPAARWVTPT